MLQRTLKQKQCAHCGHLFIPMRPLQSVCGPMCATRKVKADKAKGKRELRARKAAMKRVPDLIEEAQREFNAWCRERDRLAGCNCISCGARLSWLPNTVDAGHYRSRGSAGHLRFHEQNCHAQCKQCNRRKSGNAVDYRIGLIQRIGLEAVESLESNNAVHKWTKDELLAIKTKYARLARELRNQREA